ncbi:MAG: acetylornithine/succinylornithine family transaminase [Phycisphaerae bacterium]|jgi:predicted acetylornithine/succinylornithine family transaminase
MLTQAQIVEATGKYLTPNYTGRFPVAMVRGKGARIWDADGKEYLDFFAGFGAAGVTGHCHPAIVAAIKKQAATLTCHGNLFTNEPQVLLAEAITSHGFGGKVFYCHSGAEAIEAALKLVRLAAGPGRYKIISFHNCFHGRTMGALSLTPEKYQAGLEPMLPGNVKATYGDLASVRAAIDGETAGVFVEPIQGEGGVNVPTQEFMQGLRALCDEKNILMVVDEVWTAPARTGRWYAHQHFDVTPDAMTMAKAIGGGLPLGVCVAAPKWQDALGPGKHACTMGGNPLCTAAGLATVKLIEEEDLVGRAAAKGQEVMDRLRRAKIGCVKDVRGKGLMIGIELDKPGRDVVLACMTAGLLINCTHDTVLRLAPPLVTSDAQLRKGLRILIKALKA